MDVSMRACQDRSRAQHVPNSENNERGLFTVMVNDDEEDEETLQSDGGVIVMEGAMTRVSEYEACCKTPTYYVLYIAQ